MEQKQRVADQVAPPEAPGFQGQPEDPFAAQQTQQARRPWNRLRNEVEQRPDAEDDPAVFRPDIAVDPQFLARAAHGDQEDVRPDFGKFPKHMAAFVIIEIAVGYGDELVPTAHDG